MSNDETVRDALHEATHRVPGVPPHQDSPEGHQGTTHHGRSRQSGRFPNLAAASRHQAHRPPSVMVRWQNWIGSLFSPDSN